MICGPLAATGATSNLLLSLVLAIVFLLVGAGLLLVARQRRRRSPAITLLVILLVAVVMTLVPAPLRAQAAGNDCTSADNSLTVTQTSVMEGLTPGAAPKPITGLVRNNGDDSTHITAVLVEITSVTAAPGAAEGTCGASDYVLLEPWMPVDKTLAPGASISFTGASIGFNNKGTNQDACKYATVHLLYTANPETVR